MFCMRVGGRVGGGVGGNVGGGGGAAVLSTPGIVVAYGRPMLEGGGGWRRDVVLCGCG